MSRLLPATLAVAALLLGAILWELQDAAGPDRGTPSRRSAAVPVARAAPEAEPGDVLQGWVATALERPLFRTDRRPDKTSNNVAVKGDEPLRLSGVLTGPFGNSAIFMSAADAKPVVMKEGMRVGDFVVRSIEPGGVVVEAGGRVRTLKPSFAQGAVPPPR